MADFLFTEFSTNQLKVGTDIVLTSGRAVLGKAPGHYVSDGLATTALQSAHPRLVGQSANGRFFRAVPDDGAIPVEIAGAAGDGTTDDRVAVQAALAYGLAVGAPDIAFHSPAYSFNTVPTSEFVFGDGPQPCLVPGYATRTLDGRGATFRFPQGGRCIAHASFYAVPVDCTVAADIPAGATDIPLIPGAVAQLAVGNEVMWQLGELPYDTPETLNWGFARIVSITGNTVRLDRPISEPFTLATVTGANKRLRKLQVVRDFKLRDILLDTPDANGGFFIKYAERLTIERVGGRKMGNGTVIARYCDGITLVDCWQEGFSTLQANFGGAFNFSQARDVVLIRPRGTGIRTLVTCEAGAEATVVGAQFENTATDATGQPLGRSVSVFAASGRGKISAHDTTVTGYGNYLLSATSNGQATYDGVVRFSGRTRLIHPTDPWQIPIGQMSGTLDMTIGGVREIYNLDRLRHWRRRFPLRDGQYLSVLGPMGIVVKARAYVSPGVTVGPAAQVYGFTLGREGDNGSNIAAGSFGGVTPGTDNWLDIIAGAVGGTQWSKRHLPLLVNVGVASGAGLDLANEFIEIEAWMAEPDGVDQPLSEANWRGNGSERETYEVRFASYDLPSIAAGGALTVDFPVPDMAAVDFINGITLGNGLAGLAIRSAEAIAGAARVIFFNPTTSAVDRGPIPIAISYSKPLLGS
jgi:hypothetical protein